MYNYNWHTCLQDSAEGYKHKTIKSTAKASKTKKKGKQCLALLNLSLELLHTAAFKGALKHLSLMLQFLCHSGFSFPLVITSTLNRGRTKAPLQLVTQPCIIMQEKVGIHLNVARSYQGTPYRLIGKKASQLKKKICPAWWIKPKAFWGKSFYQLNLTDRLTDGRTRVNYLTTRSTGKT